METLTLSDYEALAELRYQIRRFLSFSEQAARAAGLEPRQHQLLLGLKGLPAEARPTIGELAERLQIQHHSTVELVNRLSAAGYIRRGARRRRPARGVAVAYSQGEKVLRKLSLHHRAELRSAGPALVKALRRAMQGSRVSNGYPSEGCRWEEEIIQLRHVEQFCCESVMAQARSLPGVRAFRSQSTDNGSGRRSFAWLWFPSWPAASAWWPAVSPDSLQADRSVHESIFLPPVRYSLRQSHA